MSKLDIIVWGATGFTGRLVAEYLLEHRARWPALRWALAARSREKLHALQKELAAKEPSAADLPLVLAESHDEASLRAMVAQARVICTTVGPYSRYGEPLLRVVAEEGASYCDLTGETPWMRAMIDRYHALAAARGARIVHTCGFDSIPSDLGVQMVQDHAMATYGVPCSEVRFFIRRIKGGFSGGTVASMQVVMDQARDPQVRRVLFDPYALDPKGDHKGPDGRDQMGLAFDDALQQWTGPFMMGPVNTRVVRRSHALLGRPWGDDFRYSECSSHGSGLRGMARAAAMTAAVSGLQAALMLPPTRAVMMRFFAPAPGEGPSRDEIEAGFFAATLLGLGCDAEARPFRVRGNVKGERDPGYGETAKMLAESALCLALDRDRLPARAGVLTPATAMGPVLTERLRAAGMVFEVESEHPS